MMRAVLGVLVLATVAAAHGGTFRPPPGRTPGDPTRGRGPGGLATTPGGSGRSAAVTPWQAWWYLNREPYLRIRQRIVEREVITGRGEREDFVDRAALRKHILEEEVLKGLRDRAHEVRGAAAIAAGKFRMHQAVPILQELFRRDKVRSVREAAVLGLMLMRDPELRPWMRERALDAREPRLLRGIATLGLGLLEDNAFLERLADRRGIRLQGSNTAQDDVRACAALALGACGRPSSIGPLVRVAYDRDSSRGARGYATCALGRLDSPLAEPDLLAIIRDEDFLTEARYGAAIAVGGLVGPEQEGTVDLLAKIARRDKNGGVRALLVLSLGRIGGDAAVQRVVKSMTRCEQRLRGFHYLALGISGHPDPGAILLNEFDRLKNSNDRAACALALGLLDHKAAAKRLRGEVGRKHPAFAPHGMIALGLLDDAESIPLVRRIVRDTSDPVMRREGVIALALLRRTAAIPELIELFEKDKTQYGRGAIASALGLVGTATAVRPLLAIYHDRNRDGEERAVALAALGRLGDEELVPLLSRYAVDLNPYVTNDSVSLVLGIL